MKEKRIGVLMGGLSVEREVSLRTGAAVAKALKELGYRIVEIDVQKDLPQRLLAEKVEVAFIALHGRYGEDGTLQGLLEAMFIPYTGSGVLASAVGMEKAFAKQIFVAHGIPTPAHQIFPDAKSAIAAVDALPFPFPVVVKPSREGSSVGVHICKTRDEYAVAVKDAVKYAGVLMVEQFIKGKEVQGAVLDDEALGVIEIVPAREFYDYEAKYKAGSGTQYIFPARLPPVQYGRVNAACLAAHKALGCSGATRSDVIATESGEVYLLEVNTLPGMTATSLLPKIAAGKGIDFPALCERILLGASLKA
jgi:D-alanine-D-alanine ligase